MSPSREPHEFEHAAFFEMSLDHFCVAGLDGYWKHLNPAWSRTLGWTPEEMRARPILDFVHPEDRPGVLAAREDLFAGRPLFGLTNRYRCKDGSYRWFEWRSVSHPERQVVYATARDVTEQKEAERALQEMAEAQRELERKLAFADRMASMGTLAAGVAHEINNPLAFVASNLDLLLEELGEADAPRHPESWRETLREARRGCDRIRRIVRGLMTFSRAEEERREVLEVVPVLEASVGMVLNEIRHRARLVREYSGPPPVEANEAQLGQVFLNLLINAAQALPEGHAADHEIRVTAFTDPAGHAVVEFLDTGSGLPEEGLERLFDPFFTTKPVGVGTGLGLSICHHHVAAMGGRIVAGNRSDRRGACFRVILPPASEVPPKVALEPAPPAPAPAPRSSSVRVLVVDDEPVIRRVLGRVLREHRVTAVDSARRALELVAAGEDFDVILSDLMMPDMSGMELHESLLALAPAAAERMVFMTGGAFTPAAEAFLERVPNRRLYKPFELTDVRTVVEEFVPPAPA